MRAIFYSPMAKPAAEAASGVARIGALMQRVLRAASVEVLTPALPTAFEGSGDAARQEQLQSACLQAAAALLDDIKSGRQAAPQLWFSYHVYYKAPDWIGPSVSRALAIPYVVAEGSHAPKRAGGPWALGHEGATAALRAAGRLLAMTRFDRVCLDHIAPGRVRDLKPFIDVAPFASRRRGAAAATPAILAVGMMRNARKRASYELLASALKLLSDVEWRLAIAGDGLLRGAIEGMFEPLAKRTRFLGEVAPRAIAELMASADVFAWPGVGEAYGLAYLEAQAAGLPVVACSDRGVPDVTVDGTTALLSAPGDAAAFAANLRRVLVDEGLRRRLGEAGRRFVSSERDIAAAASTLGAVLAELGLT